MFFCAGARDLWHDVADVPAARLQGRMVHRPHGAQVIALYQKYTKTQYRKFETNIPRKGIARPQSQFTHSCTANEGPVRIQYKCLVPIYLFFPEMKLLFPKQKYYVLSPSSYTHISVRYLYISRIGLSILLKGNTYVDRSWEYVNRSQTHDKWDFRLQRMPKYLKIDRLKRADRE